MGHNSKTEKHAPDAFGDARTLCGFAYEGEAARHGDGVRPVLAQSGELITCEHCLMIIEHCKQFIRNRMPKSG